MPLANILSDALRNIDPEQVVHPGLGLQERVLCYELYHQLRVLEERGQLNLRPARIQGELNKQAQHYFLDRQAVPDFLFHEPGTNQFNIAVIEAKRAHYGESQRQQESELRADLDKLSRFALVEELRYENRFMIISSSYQELLVERRDWVRAQHAEHGLPVTVLFHDVNARTVVPMNISYALPESFQHDA